MDHKQRSRYGLSAAALIAACSFVVSSAIADVTAGKPDVKEINGPDGISWETSTAYKAARLVVSGPEGFRLEQDFAAGDTLFLDFASVVQKSGAANGQFTYELVFTPFMTAADKALAEEARSLGVEASALGASSISPVSGVFTLDNGNPVDVDLPETTLKDQVILDDLIVDGSLCVGQDCVNGESFGFDTIRIKENNLRIKALDTSSSASFPTQDWQLTFNDSSNGGQNKFAVECVSPGSSTPFTVEGCAPSHSLYVDDGGRIGLGTNSPVVELHVKDGDTPTLRLEQDGSSGFTPQTWDVAGNEAGFFIRDTTNGSKLVFRIRPDAPTSSIDVAGDGDVGMGTSSPDGRLHLSTGTSDTLLVLEQTGTVDAQWEIKNNEATGRLTFGTTAGGPTQVPFKFGPDAVNNLLRVGTQANDQVDIAGNLVITGNCTEQDGACADYVFEPGYEKLSLAELREFITVNQHLPNVPSTDEIQKTGVNMTHFSGRLLEKIEELVLYTLEQQETIEHLDQVKGELEMRIAKLEAER